MTMVSLKPGTDHRKANCKKSKNPPNKLRPQNQTRDIQDAGWPKKKKKIRDNHIDNQGQKKGTKKKKKSALGLPRWSPTQNKKIYSIGTSQLVPHASTNPT